MQGGVMKGFFCAALLSLAASVLMVAPAWPQEEYTFVTSSFGPHVCIGRWIPSTDVGQAGTCEGQLIGVPQLTAVSARQSVDRLDQLISVMVSIDQKMDINSEQMDRLIEATLNAQQLSQVNEFLRNTISHRFAAIPEELLKDKSFSAEINRLRGDILKEVEKRYPAGQAPATN
jgi:hypothetical protein